MLKSWCTRGKLFLKSCQSLAQTFCMGTDFYNDLPINVRATVNEKDFNERYYARFL